LNGGGLEGRDGDDGDEGGDSSWQAANTNNRAANCVMAAPWRGTVNGSMTRLECGVNRS
jgi:hypothetical protein